MPMPTTSIPAVVANRYVLAKVDGLLVDMEEVALGVIDLLASGEGAEA